MALTTATASAPGSALAGRGFRRRLWLAFFGIGLLFVGALTGEIIRAATAPPGPRTLGQDLLPGYVAGRLAREGRYRDLYVADVVAAHAAQVMDEADLGGDPRHAVWINPPFYAWVFIPLAALPYRTAAAAYLVLNIVFLAAGSALLCRLLARQGAVEWASHADGRTPGHPTAFRRDWRTWALVPAILLCSAPLWQVLAHQQNTFFSLAIAAWAVWLARTGRPALAGAVAGLLLFKPQLGAVVGVATVLLAGRRAAVGLLCTAVGLVVLSEATMPGALSAWARGMPPIVRGLRHDYAYNWCRQVTLRGFWRLLLQGNARGDTSAVVDGLWVGAWTALAAPLALATLRAWRRSAADRERCAVALLVSMPLLMPYYMDYDLLLLAIPAVLVAGARMDGRASDGADGRWSTAACAGHFVAAWVNPLIAPALRVNLTVVTLLPLAGLSVAACIRSGEERATISAEGRDLATAAAG
jgi:hypothetical protein